RLWADPANWTLLTYRCPEDPRIFVPKRRPWFGWTVNFGHPLGWLAMVGCIVVAASPGIYLVLTGHTSPIQILGVTAVAVTALILFCIWDATRDRT
ncbi:MAG TPA: DUF5808 domain-containing protein, partial [Gemmatimonadales bacterium]